MSDEFTLIKKNLDLENLESVSKKQDETEIDYNTQFKSEHLNSSIKANLKLFNGLESNMDTYRDFFSDAERTMEKDELDDFKELKKETKNIKARSEKRHKHHQKKMASYSYSIRKNYDSLHSIRNHINNEENAASKFHYQLAEILVKNDIANQMYKYQMHYIRNFGAKDIKEKRDEAAVHLCALLKQESMLKKFEAANTDNFNLEGLADYTKDLIKQFNESKQKVAQELQVQKEAMKDFNINDDFLEYKLNQEHDKAVFKDICKNQKNRLSVKKFCEEAHLNDYMKTKITDDACLMKYTFETYSKFLMRYDAYCREKNYLKSGRFDLTLLLKQVRLDNNGEVIKEDKEIDAANKKILDIYYSKAETEEEIDKKYNSLKPVLKQALLRVINRKNLLLDFGKIVAPDDYEEVFDKYNVKNIKKDFYQMVYEAGIGGNFQDLFKFSEVDGKKIQTLGNRLLMELGMKNEKDYHFFEKLSRPLEDSYYYLVANQHDTCFIQIIDGSYQGGMQPQSDEDYDETVRTQLTNVNHYLKSLKHEKDLAKENSYCKLRFDMAKKGRPDWTLDDLMDAYKNHIDDFKKLKE